MDERTRQAIIDTVSEAMSRAMSEYEERWLTAKQLCEQFQMFTKDWLEKYGDILPNKRIKVTHLDGKTRSTRRCYAKLEIAENIRNGVYDDLKILR